MLYVLASVAIVVWVAYLYWYNSTDHWHKDKGIAGLYEDAPIVDVEEESIGRGLARTIRTTVRFEDGFRYVSHKHCENEYFVMRHIFMTDELREEILEDARKAHQTEIALRDGILS